MIAFDPDIVETVKAEIRRGNVQMNEQVASFILGCALSENGSDIAFRVDWIGTEIGFSPDVDVLELNDNEAIGYEVKGVQGDGMTKDQLYTGLGQAQLLLGDPVDNREGHLGPTPRVRRSYLAYPHRAIDLSDEWKRNFVRRVKEIPSVGLVDVQRTGFEVVVEAEPNALSPQECATKSGVAREVCLNLHGDRLRTLLDRYCKGKSVKNPDRSLAVLGERIADDNEIELVSFT